MSHLIKESDDRLVLDYMGLKLILISNASVTETSLSMATS